MLLRELRDKAMEGPLDPRNPPPDGYGPMWRLWGPPELTREFFEPAPFPEVPPSRDEDMNAYRERKKTREDKRLQRLDAIKKWEAEERTRFEVLRQQAEGRAAALAQKKIPSSIDISLLGGGWAFLLEFSTVIVHCCPN